MYNDAILTAPVYAGSTTTTTTTTQRRRRSQRGCPDYATQNVRANNELGQVSAWLTLFIRNVKARDRHVAHTLLYQHWPFTKAKAK
jgi:hypothetical protein